MRREYEVDVQGGMRQYLLTELELVTGMVGGLAIPKERRKGMMKDDGLKVRPQPLTSVRPRVEWLT